MSGCILFSLGNSDLNQFTEPATRETPLTTTPVESAQVYDNTVNV